MQRLAPRHSVLDKIPLHQAELDMSVLEYQHRCMTGQECCTDLYWPFSPFLAKSLPHLTIGLQPSSTHQLNRLLNSGIAVSGSGSGSGLSSRSWNTCVSGVMRARPVLRWASSISWWAVAWCHFLQNDINGRRRTIHSSAVWHEYALEERSSAACPTLILVCPPQSEVHSRS